MAVDLKPIDVERLVEKSSVAVPRLWLESGEKMRGVIERVDSTRTKRRAAEAIQPFCVNPPGGPYDGLSIVIHPHGQGEEITVTFEGIVLEPFGSDRMKFGLRADPQRPGYLLDSKEKLVEPAWGGGCLAPALRRELIKLLPAEKVVWELSERFSRAVDDTEMEWDWQPGWNLDRVSTPDAGKNLDGILEGKDCPFAVLGSWSFAVEEKEWMTSGVRVRVVFNPAGPAVAAAWSEEWHMFF